jgi:hypothetical protein
MQRFPTRSRRLVLAARLAALSVIAGIAGTASADIAASATANPTRPAVARPGDFCTSASCRPVSARLLSGAAFAATVLAIGWQARRRESREL